MNGPGGTGRRAIPLLLLLSLLLLGAGAARAENARVHALTGARVVAAPGVVWEDAVVVIRDGLVAAAGPEATVPPDAWVWDLSGKTVYPGLIESYLPLSSLGGEKKAGGTTSHPIARVRPEVRAADLVDLPEKDRERWREAGFTTLHVVPDRGIFRGRGAVLNTGDGEINDLMLVGGGEHHLAFEHGKWEEVEYPHSLMGAVAVARQTLLDARWYAEAQALYRRRPAGLERPAGNRALEDLRDVAQGRETLILVAADVLDVLRLGRLVDEFDLQARLVGAGDEYRRLPEVRALGLPLVLPVAFPKAPKAQGESEWLEVPLRTLRHWDRAPSNPAWLQAAGVSFALTTNGLESPDKFREGVRKAIRRGLPEEAALAAVTATPARLLGLGDRLGAIRKGMIANLLVTDGPLFAEKTKILEVWVDGERFEVHRPEGKEMEGRYDVAVAAPGFVAPREGTLKLERGGGFLKIGKRKARLRDTALEEGRFRFVFDAEDLGLPEGVVAVEGAIDKGLLKGGGPLPAAGALSIEGAREKDAEEPVQVRPTEPPRHEGGPIRSPETVLVRGATIWTSGPEGILEDADLLVRDGRVAAVGRGLAVPRGAEVIEAAGRHVTPGIVDPHNHSAIVGGVNEGTRATSSEVRIGDVINSETVNIYRQLAGGTTALSLLHGSANPIGGQSASIKLRWGMPPDGLLLEGAAPTIKMALGENVKQSNWGDKFTTRFPQTRMGVEQAFREKFLEALDYRDEHRAWRRGRGRALPPRRDLQLEALVEVLEGERLTLPHSYRQDEILMLMRVAEEFGFTIGTFQHILEGYKVADEMAAHGAAGSSFSDWWAYKFEVYDAIPYNGAVMWDRGVLTSFNSDSTELARRLNLEAAKAVKYGGLPREEALKFVTINPAIQMGADHRIGSLEPGKDADFVIWSGDPLSTATRVDQAWVDGNLYFDREHDLAMREGLLAERAALIEKAKKRGGGDDGDDKDGGGGKWLPSYFQDGEEHTCFPFREEVTR